MEIKRFLGIKNTTSPERLKEGDLQTGVDVDIDNTGKIMSRRGRLIVNSAAAHSLYTTGAYTYLAQGANLKGVEANFSYTQIKALTVADPISYVTTAGVTYYSNGTDKGRLIGRQWSCWGITPPVAQPVATATLGSLPPGRYLYAMTFVRNDGYESGTGLSGYVDLTANGGISFTSVEVSDNTEVTEKIMYISGTNGEDMYRAFTMTNAQTTASYLANGLDLTIPLDTQLADPPPVGNMVQIYNGVAYVVTGDTVFYSDAYRLELFRLDSNYISFPGHITMFAPVKDGIYVGTDDETYFLAGGQPDKFQPTMVFDYGVIPGTSVLANAAFFETSMQSDSEGNGPGEAVVWTSKRGICIGLNGGQVRNYSESKYSFPSAQRGTGLVRQYRGFAQYVVTLQGTGDSTNIFTQEI